MVDTILQSGHVLPPPQSGHGIHCGQLILRKISKNGATRCQILRLKCIKFDFRRPRWGSLQRSPDPLALFKGPTSKGREGEGGKERKGRKGLPPIGESLDPPVRVSVEGF